MTSSVNALTTLGAFRRWRRQRLPLVPFVGVAAIVAQCANAFEPKTVLLAFVWVTALRLWDDVHSADDDATAHPERAVVVGPRGPYQRAAVVAVCVAAGAAVLFGHGAFVAVIAFLGAVYAAPSSTALSAFLVLLKYPAMAWVLGDGDVTWTRLLLLTALFVVDEKLTGSQRFPARAIPFIVTALLLAFIVAEVYERALLPSPWSCRV